MPYPKQLTLSQEAHTRLVNWLDEQLINHYGERISYMEDLARYQRDYWAKTPTTPNTFPFHNSANIIIPLTAIAFEAVHARSMMTLFAMPQYVSVKLPEKFTDLEAGVERYLDHVFLRRINIRKKMEPSIMETGKFGTGIAKTGYVDQSRQAVFYDENGVEEVVDVTIDKGPTVDSVPNSRYLMPMQSQDPQTAPWVGEEHVLTPMEVKAYVQSGYFKKGLISQLSSWLTAPTQSIDTNSYDNTVDELQNRTPVLPQELIFQEIWTDFDLGNGKDTAICVWYHKDSRTIASIRYNWFRDLRRPYRKGNYIPLEFRWHGVGIAKQNEQFQAEVTTQHRQRIDNGTIANTQMFKVARNSGISMNEPIYPGKMWFVDNMEDVQAMPMSDVKASSYNNENQAVIFSQQRTGVNELTLGMPQAGTPGTATDSMARVQESARKFDYTHSNIRTFVNEINQDTVLNLVQFGPRDVEIFEFIPNGIKVEQFFKNPYEYFRKHIIHDIQLVGQNSNRLLDRQTWQQLTQQAQLYFQSKLELAQQTGNQELVAQITQQALAAADELFRQLLETHDLRNIHRIIPSVGQSPTQQGATPGPSSVISSQNMGNALGNPQANSLLQAPSSNLGAITPIGMFPTG